MKGFILMITFFTRLPIKYSYEYMEKDFIKGILYVPIIGLVIGLFIWAVSFLNIFLDRIVSVLLIWLSYVWITGGLHIDGLADTFDGIFSNRDRDKILEIMKDSRIGTFGVLAVIFTIFLNLALSYNLNFKYLTIVPVIGRSSAIISCSMSKYARNKGMGKSFVENCGLKEALTAIFISIILAAIYFDYIAITSILITFIFTLFITQKIKDKIGGMTGDTVGAVIELSQTFFMLSCYFMKELVF